MFGSKKASASDLKLAQNSYEELLNASDALLKRLRAFESVMLATPQTKFDELMVASEPMTVAAETAAPAPEQKLYFRGELIEG